MAGAGSWELGRGGRVRVRVESLAARNTLRDARCTRLTLRFGPYRARGGYLMLVRCLSLLFRFRLLSDCFLIHALSSESGDQVSHPRRPSSRIESKLEVCSRRNTTDTVCRAPRVCLTSVHGGAGFIFRAGAPFLPLLLRPASHSLIRRPFYPVNSSTRNATELNFVRASQISSISSRLF